MVQESGPPYLCGVVDLERASWDDPLNDLAQTRLHMGYHDPDGPTALVEAYGVERDDERQRLDVYELLHAVEERTWITGDRPYGWQLSVEALDTFLAERTREGRPVTFIANGGDLAALRVADDKLCVRWSRRRRW